MALAASLTAMLAEKLDEAERSREAIDKITDAHPEISIADAYDIQFALRARKEQRGIRVSGLKMGLTSNAKMKQMGVAEPVYGFLTDQGAIPDGGEVRMPAFIHPRVEAEIAVITKRELAGPGCHVGQVMAAIDCVLPAVELLDSRYRDFRFDLPSVIADNTSAAGFVTGGRPRCLSGLDLRTLGVVLLKNGEVIETGAGAAVLGNPAESVARLANMLAARGLTIPAGSFVMTGGITAAVAVEPGDSIEARYQELGGVSLRFIA